MAAFAARAASHAGTWYTDSKTDLAAALDGWLDAAVAEKADENRHHSAARAVIAPHAGYSYSGSTAAFAYAEMERAARASPPKRVFVLGPSHHRRTRTPCELSGAATLETPLGPLTVDRDACAALRAAAPFGTVPRDDDEDEHSIEMHLPYVHRALARAGVDPASVGIVPVLVGALSRADEARYGRALAPHLDDPSNFFVVSSDFCHWGERFRYTYVHEPERHGAGEVYRAVEALDRLGMAAIETQQPARFAEYQDRYSNTVCGRHPISVLLHALAASGRRHSTRFLRYAQSSHARSRKDSSVSYASAVVRVE